MSFLFRIVMSDWQASDGFLTVLRITFQRHHRIFIQNFLFLILTEFLRGSAVSTWAGRGKFLSVWERFRVAPTLIATLS